MKARLVCGDVVEALAGAEAESFDAVLCDPPYGLEFMGRKWDAIGKIGQSSHSGEFSDGSFKGFRIPSYSASSNVKCAKCERWKWDYPERKCTCERPEWPNVAAHQGRIMQDWHERWARAVLRVLKPGGPTCSPSEGLARVIGSRARSRMLGS